MGQMTSADCVTSLFHYGRRAQHFLVLLLLFLLPLSRAELSCHVAAEWNQIESYQNVCITVC